MRATLVIIRGKANKSQIALNLPTVIGRSRDADLTVAHPMISRQHCELYDADGLLMVRDLGSLNGTFVDGRQITEVGLRPEDEFSIGPLTFRVDYEFVGPVGAAGVAPGETDLMSQSDAGGEAPDFDAASGIIVQAAAETAEIDETIPTPGLAPEALVDDPQEAHGPQGSAEHVAPESPLGIAPADGQLPDFSQWDEAIGDSSPETASPETASPETASPDAPDQPDSPPPSDGDDEPADGDDELGRFLDGLS